MIITACNIEELGTIQDFTYVHTYANTKRDHECIIIVIL